jgi:hypothetical protein
VGQVGGHQDRLGTVGRFGQPDGLDRRKLDRTEVTEDLVFAPGDPEGLLLQGVEAPVVDEEPDEMARGADRELAQVVIGRRPLGERRLPGQSEQTRGRRPESEVRKGRRGREVAQSRFRR